ncbi:peptidoglycan recognition protein 6 [Boleophthalmus pectinirostris]|uniref:peptidoglycan recognition protein 6 n=1 Tax=Boleophthalmus pectinirostris TaxID=150288 RepID=UPI00242E17BA|nr:peptidoglycan recognition protein 6 [Boleophthalmus pectinirostris]
MANQWRCTLVLLGVLLVLGIEASSRHMDDFIKALKELEDSNPDLRPVDLLRAMRNAAGLSDPLIQHYLGKPTSASPLHSSVSKYLISALQYNITDNNQEVGVVFTRDGTTVALRPLLLGIEAGFFHRLWWDVQSSSVTTESPQYEELGPDGCWDNLTNPQRFTLTHKPNLLTTAQVNGGMDGVILAREALKSPSLKLSALLSLYYNHQLDERGLDAAPRIISRRRRDNFKELMESSEGSLGVLRMEAVTTVDMHRRMKGQKSMNLQEKKQMMAVINNRVKELLQTYADCAPIIKRCTWGAEPYRGTPTYLGLPLRYLYIHHTAQPSQPCLTFDQCAADMRSMQRYHQNTNGWADIGYSFVAGSDGNLYEGRGWNWMGAHTAGQNSISYGVAFIGDYTSVLPSGQSLELVRNKFTTCAVRLGNLVSSYIVHGHRQASATSCPGDALYRQIQSWEHFGY